MSAVNAVVLAPSDVRTPLPATSIRKPPVTTAPALPMEKSAVLMTKPATSPRTPSAPMATASTSMSAANVVARELWAAPTPSPTTMTIRQGAMTAPVSSTAAPCTWPATIEPTANIDDNSCEFGTCPGCNDPEAFNYNPTSSNDEICGGTCGDPLYFNGKFYQTGLFDSGCWMVEDLQFSPQQWISSANEVSCDIPKTYLTADSTVVYNWPAANQSCPVGWRLPNGLDESEGFLEFQDLSEYLETGGCSGSGYLETISEGINIYWLSEGSWGASNLNEWIFLGSINASYGFSVRCIKE